MHERYNVHPFVVQIQAIKRLGEKSVNTSVWGTVGPTFVSFSIIKLTKQNKMYF